MQLNGNNNSINTHFESAILPHGKYKVPQCPNGCTSQGYIRKSNQ